MSGHHQVRMRETVRPNCHTWTQSHLTSGHTPTVSDTRCRCAETEPEPSSRTAGRCVEHLRTWTKGPLRFYSVGKPYRPSFISHTRTVTPRYQPPSMADSVTSHCITLILFGQTIKLREPSQETRKLGTLRAPTPHWRAINNNMHHK